MCGIIGIYNLDGRPVSPVLLREMTDAISHRGPDGEGFYIDSFIGLGHRRLSIIDLSASGHQPMISQDNMLAITFNGEIYNFHELRRELESLGRSFVSNSDTEVLLQAYQQWGSDCLNRLNGMFAFAIWDKNKQELFLARDRYGIKPLYYTFVGSTFLFASELKAILAHPKASPQMDNEALVEYFTFQNIFSDRTLLKGAHVFPSGSYARLPLGNTGMELNPVQYWDYSFEEPATALDNREYEEELSRLFQQAVKRQLVSDVELGTYLSGGMDSGAIAAIASNELPYLKSFTCGFDLSSASGMELAFDERQKAERMSYLFKTEHYEMVLKAGDMERIFPKIAWHIEEPRIGQSYPNYYTAQLASKFVKVVLSGAGGDEIFAGYPWRYYRAIGHQNFEQYIDEYYSFWQRLVPNDVIQSLFQPIWGKAGHVNTREIFKSVFPSADWNPTRPEDFINRSLYFEAKTFLHGLLLIEDKLTMAHGLEMRVPLLDNDLVDFAMKLPVSMKLANLNQVIKLNENEPGNKTSRYYQQTNDGKKIFRKVMEEYIPKEITDAVKQGFSAPDASWFKGESIEYIRREIMNNSARIYEFLDHKTVHHLLTDHMEGRENRRLLIWSLLCFEWWLRTYFK